jgi:hypothetical protein
LARLFSLSGELLKSLVDTNGRRSAKLRIAFQTTPPEVPILPSFHHQAEQGPCGDADRKSRCHREHGVPLDALGCVIKEFFGSIAALFCGAPYCSHAIFNRVGNRACCARCPLSRPGNMVSRSFHYGS